GGHPPHHVGAHRVLGRAGAVGCAELGHHSADSKSPGAAGTTDGGHPESLNNSMLHLGIALGSFVGSTVIDRFGVMYNARVGALFVLLALGAALVSFRHPRTVTAKP